MSDLESQMLQIPERGFLSNYGIAKSQVDNAVESHRPYWRLIKICQNHFAGEKPIPFDELKKRGMGWVANWNFNKGKAKISKGVIESQARVSDALTLSYVTFRKWKKDDPQLLSFLRDNNTRGIVASKIGYAFIRMLSEESRLTSWLSSAEHPSYAYGYAVALEQDGDWIPEIIHPLHIAFKPETKPDEIESWITFKTISGQELFRQWTMAKNEAKKKLIDKGEVIEQSSSGWNIIALEEILLRCFRGKMDENKVADSWAEVLPHCYSNPSWVIQNTDSVKIACIYWKELDGTLSETFIPYDNTWINDVDKRNMGIVNQNTVEGHILKSKNLGQFNQEEKIQLIRDSGFSETGFIQDCRGIAQFAAEDSIRYNRGRNSALNKIMIAGQPMFEASSTVSVEKFKLNVSHGYSILPPGYSLTEKQPSASVSEQIGMLRFEESEYLRETDQFDADLQGKLSSRPNKDEVRAASSQVAATKAAKDSVKFRDYACLFYHTIRRLKKSLSPKDKGYSGRRRFLDYCHKELEGLVETDQDIIKILDTIDSYVIAPIMGDVETIMMAIQMAETPYARNRFRRMLLVAKGMPIEEVNSAVPLISDKMTDMQDARIAMFENDSFWNGADVVVVASDDHIIHLDTHIQKAVNVIQGVQQQRLAPPAGSKYLINLVQHIAEHVDALGKDPILNSKAGEYMDQLKQVAEAANKIHQAAQQILEQQEQAANQPAPMDPETQAEIERKNALAISKEQRSEFITQAKTERADRQLEINREVALAKVEVDREVKLQKVQNE